MSGAMSGSEVEIQAVIQKLIDDIAEDLDSELDGPISAQTRLVGDLGLASVDFIQLIVGIEQHFGRKMKFHDLLMPEGTYVNDLTVGELVAFVASKLTAKEPALETTKPAAFPASAPSVSGPVIDPEMLAAFRAKTPSRGCQSITGAKLPRTAFVLTSPRSGSTLLRIILAGHPGLFAPPELHLLDYADLAQRKAALNNPLNEHLLTGTLRALMQLTPCSQEEAAATMGRYEEQKISTHDFYFLLQRLLGDRLLVEKSPIYCLYPWVLQRLEDEFDQPLYVHLVRHPQGMIRSFEDAKIDALIPFMRESGYSRRQLAELTWLVSHQNATTFLQAVPAERQILVRFEEVVQESEATGRRLCDFLDIPFVPEMLDPYLEKERRMTDGLKVASQYSGDLKFHLHGRIEPTAADRWKQYTSDSVLSPMTYHLAESLGYSFPA
jgi:acyl carrier protein